MSSRETKHRWQANILYHLMRLWGYLPSWWHYGVSWLISYILQYVVRYRREVIRRNLAHSFPEMSERELRQVERRFYRHLSDIGVEVVMLAAFDEKRFRRHVELVNPELVEELHRENKRIFFLLGHYGNWEWFTGCQLLLPATEFNVTYVRQHGPWHYVLSRLRSKFGTRLNERAEAVKVILRERNEPTPKTYIMVADQSPNLDSTELFVPFFNQTTAVVTGMDRLAKMLGAAVIYIDVERRRRGHYCLRLVEMTRDASGLAAHQLSKEFMQRLEENIRRQPELWLWSHNRWKITPEIVREHYPHKKLEIV